MKNLFIILLSVILLTSCAGLANYGDPAFLVRDGANKIIEEGGEIELAVSFRRVQYFFPAQDAATNMLLVESNLYFYKKDGKERIRILRTEGDGRYTKRYSNDEMPLTIDFEILEVKNPTNNEKSYSGIDDNTGEEFIVLIETVNANAEQYRYYIIKEGVEYQIVYLVVSNYMYDKNNF